jgi:hypothetical protein
VSHNLLIFGPSENKRAFQKRRGGPQSKRAGSNEEADFGNVSHKLASSLWPTLKISRNMEREKKKRKVRDWLASSIKN